MDNLQLYNQVRTVPTTAQKLIEAGRLRGKTDINPMWRIKTLTEQFGVVGVGWYYTIDRTWLDRGDGAETTANVEISLYIRQNEAWSMPIKGMGGSMFTSKEKGGIYTDDDCYKKALTDAISVACKALGIGADVYWNRDISKYEAPSSTVQPTSSTPSPPPPPAPQVCSVCGKAVSAATADKSMINTGKIYCSKACLTGGENEG